MENVKINNDNNNEKTNNIILNSNRNNIDVIWFDEKINTIQNQRILSKIKPLVNSCLTFENLEDGFNNYYTNIFSPIFTIVSGKFWGRYLYNLNKNINKIINIPYVVIFTSKRFKNILLQNQSDDEHILSYDTINKINDPFYNPGGVICTFGELKDKIKAFKLGKKYVIKKRETEKRNFEGVLTFEYLPNEDDLLAPALYKEIITNEPIKENEIQNLVDYFFSFDNKNLNNLYLNLKYFKNIPQEIFSKYSARAYTYETEFYKSINNDLMKSKINDNYKAYIKILYNGIEINSFSSFTGKYLYRGAMINKAEIIKIMDYKDKGKLNNIVAFSKAFLSFSETESEAKKFLKKANYKFLRILFVLENFNTNNQESNADIHYFSAFENEKEILFFPGSSFIIKDINYLDNENVKLILNYNGKFKEKYNIIYENKGRLNELLRRNILTKFIAGKEMEFIKNGEYLIIKTISDKSIGFIKRVMKAKDLKNNQLVFIKEIWDESCASYDEKYYAQLTYLLNKLKKSKYSCALKDTFTINNAYYMVVDIYDDNLYSYLSKIGPKGIPPNLIKKIMIQLKDCFFNLVGELGERSINPMNISIKYNNAQKNNFDVFLSENGIYEFDNEFSSYFYYHPSIINIKIHFPRTFTYSESDIKMQHELFNIGITLYQLYFNKLPFVTTKDMILYKKYVLDNHNLDDKDYDPLEYPLLKDLSDKKKTNPWYNDKNYIREAIILSISKKRDIWIDNLSKDDIFQKQDLYNDKLFYDLLCKLIQYNTKESIKNYKDLYNHPFFSQYQY